MSDRDFETPWMNVVEASRYLNRGRRFVGREIKAGRLRGAIIGGRREFLTRREWCDEWVTNQTAPIPITVPRRRVG